MKPFTFAVFADSHIRLESGSNGYDFYPSNAFANARSRYIVQKVNQFDPNLAIHLGDVIYPIPALSPHETAVKMAHDLYSQIKSPLYVVPGNHDIGDKPNAWVPAPAVTEDSHKIFEKYWGKSYASFDHEAIHFVLINTPIFNSGVSLEKEQRIWLEKDLADNKKDGKRVFLFMHYPPYLLDPLEAEHYDNIAEPARSWLLSLLKQYNVEAVFSAHSHTFFYNRYFNTDLYVIPSVAFVRPDYSEMFRIGPAAEYGRNDVGKMGFFIVKVHEAGHQIEYIRTHGLTDEQNEPVTIRPLSLSKTPIEMRASPIGVYLRHAWASPIELTYDNLDEFTRKFVRNDYLLPALWELRIQKLRVHFGDLADNNIRERMRVLQTFGYKFTVFSVGIPNKQTIELIQLHQDLVDIWEVVVPWSLVQDTAIHIKEIKSKMAMRIMLSKLDSIDDQQREGKLEFSHFPNHGFLLGNHNLLSSGTIAYDLGSAFDGFVFRFSPETRPWEGIHAVEKIVVGLNMSAVVHVQLPRASEGVMCVNDRQISNRIIETLAASLAMENIEIWLDTFIDHDRGYYPRNGLLDRRYNPRPNFYAFRHLQHALGGSASHTIKMALIESNADIRAFSVEVSQYRCIILLSGSEERNEGLNELNIAWKPTLTRLDGVGQWLDLWTGNMRDIHWKQSTPYSVWITVDLPSNEFAPALLILETSEGHDVPDLTGEL